MSSDRRTTIGRIGERLAAERLEAGGYRVIERNYRTREGELDVIARRGEVLVFCEVKTLVARRPGGRGPAYPLESVRHAKRTKIRRLARAWMGERSGTVSFRTVRFDAIGVTLSADGRLLEMEHIEAAF
jgi:putative endonuclease